jgi:hypothetical protein
LKYEKKAIKVGIGNKKVDSKGEIIEQPELFLRSTTLGIHVHDSQILSQGTRLALTSGEKLSSLKLDLDHDLSLLSARQDIRVIGLDIDFDGATAVPTHPILE